MKNKLIIMIMTMVLLLPLVQSIELYREDLPQLVTFFSYNATSGERLGTAGTITCYDSDNNVEISAQAITNTATGINRFSFAATLPVDDLFCIVAITTPSAGALDPSFPVKIRQRPFNATTDTVADVTLTATTTTVTNAVTVGTINSDVITATSIATDAIGAAEIAANAIGASELAADAIGSSEIATAAIDADAIASDAIGAAELATNAIGSDEIAASAIGASELAADAIGASEIADNAIDAGALATDTITAAKIEAAAIGASEIATDAIGAAEIAANAIGSSELATDSIGSDQLASTAVNEIVDQNWDEAINDHVSAGTTGLALFEINVTTNTTLDATISSRGTSTLTTSDNIGVNWGDVDNQGTSVDLSATTTFVVDTCTALTTNNDKTGYSLAANQVVGLNTTLSILLDDIQRRLKNETDYQADLTTVTNNQDTISGQLDLVSRDINQSANVTVDEIDTRLNLSHSEGNWSGLAGTATISAGDISTIAARSANQTWDVLLAGHLTDATTGFNQSQIGSATATVDTTAIWAENVSALCTGNASLIPTTAGEMLDCLFEQGGI